MWQRRAQRVFSKRKPSTHLDGCELLLPLPLRVLPLPLLCCQLHHGLRQHKWSRFF